MTYTQARPTLWQISEKTAPAWRLKQQGVSEDLSKITKTELTTAESFRDRFVPFYPEKHWESNFCKDICFLTILEYSRYLSKKSTYSLFEVNHETFQIPPYMGKVKLIWLSEPVSQSRRINEERHHHHRHHCHHHRPCINHHHSPHDCLPWLIL